MGSSGTACRHSHLCPRVDARTCRHAHGRRTREGRWPGPALEAARSDRCPKPRRFFEPFCFSTALSMVERDLIRGWTSAHEGKEREQVSDKGYPEAYRRSSANIVT